MADSTLQAIRTKVRRITRSPSAAILTDAQLDEYINTFVLFDFPEQIRLFSLRTTLTFYTEPFKDVYETELVNTFDPLFNFKNKYIAVHPPIYMAGIQSFYTQWRDVFYSYYPQTNTVSDTLLRGNGGAGPFSGTLSAIPVLQNNVLFSCLDTAGASLILIDYPQTNITGILSLPNQTGVPINLGSINYVTGAFTFTFAGNTAAGAIIYSNTIAYQPGKPIAMLFYDNQFTIRPVPDKTYAIQMEVDARPTELLAANQEPQLSQWWQYISWGASLKIFQDRMDMDSAQMIMPEFKSQEDLVLRATLTTQANERTVTIYTQGKYYGFGWFGPSGWPY